MQDFKDQSHELNMESGKTMTDCPNRAIKEAVNPEHYKENIFGEELIDVMESNFTASEFVGFLKLNAFKYRMRAGTKPKQPMEPDIKKALWYEDRLSKIKKLPF